MPVNHDLHVVHEPNPLYELSARSGVLQTLEEAARATTDEFVDRVCGEREPAPTVSRRVVIGKAATRIVEVVEGGGYAHVVMGARGQTSLGERLLGSKAERVCQWAKVPVTIVKA